MHTWVSQLSPSTSFSIYTQPSASSWDRQALHVMCDTVISTLPQTPSMSSSLTSTATKTQQNVNTDKTKSVLQKGCIQQLQQIDPIYYIVLFLIFFLIKLLSIFLIKLTYIISASILFMYSAFQEYESGVKYVNKDQWIYGEGSMCLYCVSHGFISTNLASPFLMIQEQNIIYMCMVKHTHHKMHSSTATKQNFMHVKLIVFILCSQDSYPDLSVE